MIILALPPDAVKTPKCGEEEESRLSRFLCQKRITITGGKLSGVDLLSIFSSFARLWDPVMR